jgi:hypothetical protein
MNKKLRGKAKNNVAYTGIVKLSQYMNGKQAIIDEIHNEGGMPLFDFIANCLVGDFKAAQTGRPTQILLLNINEQNEVSQADNTSFIPLLALPERVYSAKEGIVKYSFIIPQEYFAAGNTEGAVRFNAIGLYADSAKDPATDAANYAALCKVKPENWSVSISTVLVLDWELHILNAPTEANASAKG